MTSPSILVNVCPTYDILFNTIQNAVTGQTEKTRENFGRPSWGPQASTFFFKHWWKILQKHVHGLMELLISFTISKWVFSTKVHWDLSAIYLCKKLCICYLLVRIISSLQKSGVWCTYTTKKGFHYILYRPQGKTLWEIGTGMFGEQSSHGREQSMDCALQVGKAHLNPARKADLFVARPFCLPSEPIETQRALHFMNSSLCQSG